ncbi:dihydrodipicolinate synthase family protein [Pseudoclavibacter sp. VKM Ac-2888]|uniref:dihydrodipicolinate synthase family protein n=1 Tax=Pseudoclavibacter sp. VKM Ac-2888 TaxID=2783830 RepID=UPI001E30669E|nr:dihydrodipicolinate synthase family protein [Pseudoclavibacter sp. VKM Ac-2888]
MSDSLFEGVSAFPLTPVTSTGIDAGSYAALVERLQSAGVDSISALGSTGSYAYLDLAERAAVAKLTVQHAGAVPVIVGIGALRTRDVLENLRSAEDAGASAVLLAPVAYQPLTEDEVYGLYEDVAATSGIPIIVYDNPTTTGIVVSDALHARIAGLDLVRSIKIPPASLDVAQVSARVTALRDEVGSPISVGISGDPYAASGLLGGCDVWYSVLAGVLPEPCLAITRAALGGEAELAMSLSARLDPLWELFRAHGSYRVASAIAAQLGLVPTVNLPRPVHELDAAGQRAVAGALRAL